MFYTQLFDALFQQEVRYLLCGGVAANLYGLARMTADVDLVIDWTDQNTENIDSALRNLGYTPLLPIGLQHLVAPRDREKLREERSLIAYSYQSTDVQYIAVDIVTQLPDTFEALWERKEVRQTERIDIYLMGIADLINMKLAAGRKQDEQDVVYLRKIMNGDA